MIAAVLLLSQDEGLTSALWGIGIFFLFLVVLIVSVVKQSSREEEQQSWPEQIGTVERHVEFYQLIKGGEFYIRDRRPRGFWFSSPPGFTYSYEVDGHYHSGAKMVGEDSLTSYPIGGKVRLRYNPKEPSDSVIVLSATYGPSPESPGQMNQGKMS